MNTEKSFQAPIENIRALMKSILRLTELKPGSCDLDTEILCAEVSLLCLSLSDDLEKANLNNAEILKQQETARVLREIAFSAMNLTSAAKSDENPQYAWDKTINCIAENADCICRLLDLPFTVNRGIVTETMIPARSQSLSVTDSTSSQARKNRSKAIALISEDDERRQLAQEIRELREELAKLVAEKAHLENDECLRLSAAYALNIGTFLSELYLAEVEVNKAKRKLQLMQAALNRRQRPESADIEEKLRKEYEQFRVRYEDFVRREEEAKEYRRKRAENEKHQQEWWEQHERERQKTAGNDNTQEEQEYDTGTSNKRENISDYMKKLYRKLTKALHPDLHPNQPPEHLDLYKRVTVAYSNGDLQTLEMAWELLQNGSAPTEKADDEVRLEQLVREKLRLLELISKIRKEIQEITSRFPYNMRDILDDPEKLAAKQEEIRTQIMKHKAAAAHFAARIDELEKKL